MKRQYPLPFLYGALLLAPVGARAQSQQPPPAASQPTFQTEVSYVDVDATVTDAEADFVAGLAKEDFELSDAGQLQRIDLFSEVQPPVDRQNRSLFMDRPEPVDVQSNREASAGRVYAIVLDDLHIAPLRTVETRRAAREFVEKYLGANDVAAVIYTSGRTDASQEFTSDPQLLLVAIDKFFGQRLRDQVRDKIDSYYQGLLRQASGAPAGESYQPAKFDRRQRASGVFDSLKNLSELLSAVRGRRKALLLFSEGFDSGTDGPSFLPSSSSGLGAMRDVLSAAARANVNVYPIDPRGLAGMTTDAIGSMAGGPAPLNLAVGSSEFFAELRASHETLRTLADETGG